MSDFESSADIDKFVGIVKLINPLTLSAYGPPLDAWAFLAKVSSAIGSRMALAQILKTINPLTASAYGPLLDSWATRSFNRAELAGILRAVNPLTAGVYGPLLDAWAADAVSASRRR